LSLIGVYRRLSAAREDKVEEVLKTICVYLRLIWVFDFGVGVHLRLN